MDNSPKTTIFISYRKKDTEFISGRLYDTLITHFAEDQVFMDYEDLEGGVDFEEAIEKMLESCDIMLAVIGPNWVGANADGSPRIMNEGDWVRLELSTALRRGVRVIPVLVEGATVPHENSLPPDLHNLRKKQTVELNNRNWKTDTEKLIRLLEKLVGSPPKVTQEAPVVIPKQRSIWSKKRTWAFGVVGLIVLWVLIGALGGGKQGLDSDQQNSVAAVEYYDVSGMWMSSDGYTLKIFQEYDQLSGSLFYKFPENEAPELLTNQSSGTIKNRRVILDFYRYMGENTDTLTYRIEGDLTPDGKTLQTTFTDEHKTVYDKDFDRQVQRSN
jgi:hypothetical protein